jgi:hypothetical protein
MHTIQRCQNTEDWEVVFELPPHQASRAGKLGTALDETAHNKGIHGCPFKIHQIYWATETAPIAKTMAKTMSLRMPLRNTMPRTVARRAG